MQTKTYYYASLLLFYIAIISFTAGCNKKYHEITITGSITDPVLGIRLQGVNVTLNSKRVSSGVYSSSYQFLGSTVSDENGNFTITIPKEKTDSYQFILRKDQYFENETLVHPDTLEASTHYARSFQMNPQSALQLRIKNTNPWNNTDMAAWQIMNSGLSCYQCCNNAILKGNGSNFDSTYTCKAIGNSSLVIMLSSTKNNSTLVRFDTVFCPVFQTVQYNLFY